MSELSKLTIDDLKIHTWDCRTPISVLGAYEGTKIYSFRFEVIECGEVNPEAVVQCNVAEGWIKYVDSTTPFGNMQQIYEHVVRETDGKFKLIKVNCKVVLKVEDPQGNFVIILKGKDVKE